MPPTFDRAFRLGAPARSFRLPAPLTGRAVAPDDYPDAAVLLVARPPGPARLFA
jgi:hypothetical protein